MFTADDLKVLESLFDRKLEPIHERLDGIDQRLDAMDQRFDGIDRRLDAMDQRFDAIEEDLAEVRGATNYIAGWVERIESTVNSKAM